MAEFLPAAGLIDTLPLGLEALFVLLFGLVLGSLNTVFCYRIPREIPLGLVRKTRSECPHCHKVLPWKWNIPVFSYLQLKGKCGFCGGAIPPRYLAIEISTALVVLTTWFFYVRSPNLPAQEFARWAEFAKLTWFSLSLVAVVFIDMEFRIIPDRFSIGNWVVALAAAVLWSEPHWIDSVGGCVMGFGLFFLMSWGYEKLKGIEGLGFGDVKMMGWIGAWLGFTRVPFVILTASLTGLAVGLVAMRRSKDGLQTAIPFGPFIAVGAYLAWVIGAIGAW